MPDAGLRRCRKQAANRPFSNIPKRAASLPQDDWIWLGSQLSLKRRDLGLRLPSLTGLEFQFTDVLAKFRDEFRQILRPNSQGGGLAEVLATLRDVSDRAIECVLNERLQLLHRDGLAVDLPIPGVRVFGLPRT